MKRLNQNQIKELINKCSLQFKEVFEEDINIHLVDHVINEALNEVKKKYIRDFICDYDPNTLARISKEAHKLVKPITINAEPRIDVEPLAISSRTPMGILAQRQVQEKSNDKPKRTKRKRAKGTGRSKKKSGPSS